MNQINWQRVFKILLPLVALMVIITLGFYFYYQIKIARILEKTTPTSAIPGFPPGFTLEDLKKIKVPEKGEKTKEGVAVPLETAPAAPQASSKLRIFELKGEKGQLSPESFIVYQNDILNIKLTSVDKDYDFRLEGYNLEIKAGKGETKTIEFQATNIGRYPFYCSLCASQNQPAGHIIVVPQ